MSPRTRKKPPAPDETAKDESDLDERAAINDGVIARLGVGRAALAAALADVDAMLTFFLNPGDDAKGKERKECLEAIMENVGMATRSFEYVEEGFGDVDFELGEPWDDEEDDA